MGLSNEHLRRIGPADSWQITATAPDTHELLSDPMGPQAAGSHTLTNHGGSVIAAPKLALVYLGPWWGDTAKLEQFAREFMERGALSVLKPYGVAGPASYLGVFHGDAVSGTVTDATLQGMLQQLITAGRVPAPDANTLYALCLPDGVTVSMGSSASCGQFCGYHNDIGGSVFYSVQTSTNCGPCHGSIAPFDAFTMVLAHEIGEACTDAVPGQGWYEDSSGMENGDLCAWQPIKYGPWTVQPLWTNESGCAMGTYTPPVPQKQTARAFVDRWEWVGDANQAWKIATVEVEGPGSTGAYYDVRIERSAGVTERPTGFVWVGP